jgi:hypothetical protein
MIENGNNTGYTGTGGGQRSSAIMNSGSNVIHGEHDIIYNNNKKN